MNGTCSRLLQSGLDIEVDDAKIAAALKAVVAEGGSRGLYAMRALGPMYILGRGLPRDAGEGMRLLKAAADAGDAEAIEYLAKVYALGMPGVPVDRNEQVRWLVRLAGQGRPDIMGLVGRMMIDPPITLLAAGPPNAPGILPTVTCPKATDG